MQIAGRETIYYSHSPDNIPSITVKPGEIFAVDTELCSGNWLQQPEDLWSREKSRGPNPTVCVGIEGAEPGDRLAVDIIDIKPETLGYTAILDKKLNLAITGHDMDPSPRTFVINDGYICWNDRLRLPIKPMIGTIGVASPEARPNSFGGYHGGNMDAYEAAAGATIYLPVIYKSALLNAGDVHAMQGDGEICNAGGIECRARLTLKTRLLRGMPAMRCVRLEDASCLAAIACLEGTDESFHLACGELIRFIRERYDITEEDCFMLLSQVMEARCTQFVNPTRSYVCKIPKSVLDAGYKKR